MNVESKNNCFLIYSGDYLYIINHNSVKSSKEKAEELVQKIESDESIVPINYNDRNSNYMVEGVLISKKNIVRRKVPFGLKVKPEKYVIRETQEMYEGMMERFNPRAPEWILAIIEGRAKGETVYMERPEYFLLPDFKWDLKHEHLYLLIVFRDLELRSIRDLRKGHIEMLKKCRDTVTEYVLTEYGISENKLRFYFHYHPSAWSLHLHVQHINSPISSSNSSSRAYLLTDIIQNLEMKPDYYKDCTLECIVQDKMMKTYMSLKS